MMKFAHMADCHIGAWRDPKMRVLGDEAFTAAIDKILSSQVDFVLIAGDLFNTAIPGVDQIKHVTRELHRLKDASIPVYLIAGSHDYSPTGKTMLDVLEEAGLCVNVFAGEVQDEKLHLSFTVDEKTGVKLCGILGRAGQLDSHLYKALSTSELEQEPGQKIFLFHTALEELKAPSMSAMDSQPAAFLPKGFSYYAGGHVHIVKQASLPEYDNVVYPGPLFPASFSELEELSAGGFFLVELGSQTTIERISISTKDVVKVHVDCTDMSPEDVTKKLSEELASVSDCIVLARVSGMLSSGMASDIDFRSLFAQCEKDGAYFCMKNTSGISSPVFENAVKEDTKPEEIEDSVFSDFGGRESLPGVADEKQAALMKKLLASLSSEKVDGETNASYESRVQEDALSVLNRS